MRFNDGPNLYILYKDIFVHRIYHFDAVRPDPFILDCGSNIGMSILYFKQRYPQARIIGFEPDPDIIPFLESNIAGNHLKNVKWEQAALSRDSEKKIFYSDGICGSGLDETLTLESSYNWKRFEVPCLRLRDYLAEPVDFLKMNIEGAEYEVLADSEDRLRRIREMIIEYHHLPGLPRWRLRDSRSPSSTGIRISDQRLRFGNQRRRSTSLSFNAGESLFPAHLCKADRLIGCCDRDFHKPRCVGCKDGGSA